MSTMLKNNAAMSINKTDDVDNDVNSSFGVNQQLVNLQSYKYYKMFEWVGS